MTIARLTRSLAVPTEPKLQGFREMREEDVPGVGKLLRRFLKRYDIEQRFESDEEVRHWFLSGSGRGAQEGQGRVVWAYVVEVGVLPRFEYVVEDISGSDISSTGISVPDTMAKLHCCGPSMPSSSLGIWLHVPHGRQIPFLPYPTRHRRC